MSASKTPGTPADKSRAEIDRQQALAARPMVLPNTNPRKLANGGCKVTVTYQPTRMQRLLLRLGPTATRTFELDPLGTSVLELCDGQRNVTQIIAAFTALHRFDPHESERAVLTFLRTLIQNGVVVMVVPETPGQT